jgi:hypothetical protein
LYEANIPSGGAITRITVQQFLSSRGNSPEGKRSRASEALPLLDSREGSNLAAYAHTARAYAEDVRSPGRPDPRGPAKPTERTGTVINGHKPGMGARSSVRIPFAAALF